MKHPSPQHSIEEIEHRIHFIRGQRVILDAELAGIYGVPTRRLNEQVRRNRSRFPEDFMFQLTAKELAGMRSQFATASKRNARYLPYAFTEYGAIMAANVLNSDQATRMSVFVVRVFVKMRETLGGTRELAQKLAELEQKLTGRLDIHERAIVDVLQKVMELLNPPTPPPEPPRRQIGFQVKEKSALYFVRARKSVRCRNHVAFGGKAG